MKNYREPNQKEIEIIKRLIELSGRDYFIEGLRVSEMNDGGMGSLVLLPKNIEDNNRKFKSQISEIVLSSEQQRKVIASLNIDQNDNLYELDIWNTDFSKID